MPRRRRDRKTSTITNKEIKQIESIFSPKGAKLERSRVVEKRKKYLAEFWAKNQNEWRKLAPRAENEDYSDFRKPVNEQKSPKIIPRGGHPDEPMIDPEELHQKVIEQEEKPKKPEKKEPEKEPPKKRDKWETVRV